MLSYTVILVSPKYNCTFKSFLCCNNIQYEHHENTDIFIVFTNSCYAKKIRQLCYVYSIVEHTNRYHIYPLTPVTPVTIPSPTNDDPIWGLKRIKAPQAWKLGYYGQDVNVAILDSGIADNPALTVKQRLSFVDSDPNVYDTLGHGTAVAGIIAANPKVSQISGAAYKCNLYSLKIGTKGPNGDFIIDDVAVLRSLDWCGKNNIQVINMSFGYDYVPSEMSMILAMKKAISSLFNQGILVVSGTGNQNTRDKVEAPALFDNVVGVGATNISDGRWVESANVGSNYGAGLNLVAPGDQITTLGIDHEYIETSGTSFSCPYVTSVVAIYISRFGPLLPSDLIDHLQEQAEALPSISKPNYLEFGYGIVQATS